MREPACKGLARDGIAAFLRGTPSPGYEFAQLGVGRMIGRKQHHAFLCRKAKLTAYEQFETRILGCVVRAYDAGERALIRDRKRRIAELFGARDKLVRMRGAALKAEIARAQELGIAHAQM